MMSATPKHVAGHNKQTTYKIYVYCDSFNVVSVCFLFIWKLYTLEANRICSVEANTVLFTTVVVVSYVICRFWYNLL